MNRSMRYLFLPLILLLFLAAAADTVFAGKINGTNIDLSSVKPPAKKGNEKIDSMLSQLLLIYSREGLAKAEQFTRAWQHPMKNGSLPVLVEAKTASVREEMTIKQNAKDLFMTKAIKNRLQRMQAHIIGDYKNYIEARIKIDHIKELAEIPAVKKVTVPFYRKHTLRSEGVQVTGASRWHAPEVNYIKRENPVKVAVLDIGFKGYENLLGIELPPEVTTRSFRDDDDISADEDHGTACAEIIYDMAPDAELYLVNFDFFDEFADAVEWLISERVDIISFSIGYFNAGAGDGTGPVNDVVNQAINAGITFVTSAGNEAVSHWRDHFEDDDNDRWLNFTLMDETNEFFAYAGDDLYVFMNWNDWYNSDQDYDLYIMDDRNRLIISSTQIQDGDDWPEEGVTFTAPFTGRYHVAVYNYSANRRHRIELFISANYPEYYTPAGSLTIPADNPNAVAAGATYWGDDGLEYFSSRGPSKDGTVKPDFTAPDGVSTVTYGDGNFFGTSAATPHIAGAIALLMDKLSVFTDHEILQIIEARSIDYGQPGKDNQFGIGRLYLLPE